MADFQQFYGCWDFRSFPPEVAAALAAELPADSRSARFLAGDVPDVQTLLSAAIVDQLQALNFRLFGDQERAPESIVARLMNAADKDPEALSFGSPEEFEAARAALLERQRKEAEQHA